MNRDRNDLQRMLEQATAANEPMDEMDAETASLRKAWLAFGELLDAGQEKSALQTPIKRERTVRLAAHRHRRFFAAAGLLAASLLIAIATTWMNRSTNEPSQLQPNQTAATPKAEQHKTAQVAETPRWDDESLDEQIEQIGKSITYAQQEQYTSTDPYGSLRYGIEQMQKDLDGNKL